MVTSLVKSRLHRQGDTLSTYIILMCSEGFSSLIRQQERRQALIGYKVAKTALANSHLFFVDDSILFGHASINSYNATKEVLHLYEKATGQQVSLQKSSLYFSPNTTIRDQNLISNYMGIQVRATFEKYLGLPQYFGRLKKQVFHYLKDKIWNHLNNWKHKVFSKGGKEVLLKSVIQAIPTYTMACFRLSIATCHSLESIMANFWNKEIKHQTMNQSHAILNIAENYLADYKTPPPHGLLKLNTDVASSNNHIKAGLGGIIRNSNGGVVAAIASPLQGEEMLQSSKPSPFSILFIGA
uniref:Reverse transcriptase n=1 Tax=Cannabis sativa TaxID=3483 RepID=A0A803P4Z4_CANSA